MPRQSASAVERVAPFSVYVAEALRSMPSGGGYAADRAAELRFAELGITLRSGSLAVSPTGASPTFCSAACYMALVRALQRWEQAQASAVFSPKVWEHLRVNTLHPDGSLSWGRVNANGPGFAKWVHDLGAGVNFSDPQAARPGDFLKFFYTPTIGAHERGHMVVFLGLQQHAGQTCIRFWSSNKPGGYGVRTVPLTRVHNLIFTRITRPERIALAPALPEHDEWLAEMLTRDFPVAEVYAKCGVRAKP